MTADEQGMRAAVGEAISTAPASRLPRLLFGGADDEPTFYWLLVPSSSGYSVAEHHSVETLKRGSLLNLDGVEYRVSVIAGSPFLDGRRCAYLEPPAANGS